MASDLEAGIKKVPLYEQSIDLPIQSGAAEDARKALIRAMRGKRRHDIKEGNFLKGMR